MECGMLKMYKDNVLVLMDRRDVAPTESGLLYTPPVALGTTDGATGTVLAVGPGTEYAYRLHPHRRTLPTDASPTVGTGFIPMETQEQDRVLLDSPTCGDRPRPETLLALGLDPERDYRIVRECEIAAVLEPE